VWLGIAYGQLLRSDLGPWLTRFIGLGSPQLTPRTPPPQRGWHLRTSQHAFYVSERTGKCVRDVWKNVVWYYPPPCANARYTGQILLDPQGMCAGGGDSMLCSLTASYHRPLTPAFMHAMGEHVLRIDCKKGHCRSREVPRRCTTFRCLMEVNY
jgi:hypothetical protein